MTSYTDKEIAAVAWAANAELQALHGDPAPSLPGDAEAHAVTVAGIRAILDGATPEQLHETWMRAREAQGWTYGPRKDSRLKTHPALIPYAELPEHQRVKDRVFTAIVQAMTAQDDGGHVARPLTATPGQALHDALRESAAIEFDLDIESFERWEYIRPSQRNRLEAAAQAVLDSATEGSLRACGYTLADVGRFLEAEVAAQEPHAAPDSNHEPGLSECGCCDCDPRRHGSAPASDPRVVPLDAAVVHKELHRLIKGIKTLAADLTASAAATRPSRKSQIEDEIAIALRKLLEDE